jgi:hypothetical protein
MKKSLMLIVAVLVTTAAMVITPMTANAQGGNATITGPIAPSGDEQVTKGGEQQIITAQEFFVLMICPDGATTAERCQQLRVDVR